MIILILPRYRPLYRPPRKLLEQGEHHNLLTSRT